MNRYLIVTGIAASLLSVAGCPLLNAAPVVDAGPDLQGVTGESVSVTATTEDANGDPLTFQWMLVSGPATPLTGDTNRTVALTPSQTGVYVLEVRVSDGSASDEDTVTVVVSEPARRR